MLILVAAILMVVAIFTPWYSYEQSGGGISVTRNFYPGIPSTNGTIQSSCSGIPSCPGQDSYSNENLNNTGQIAEVGFFLLIGGLILGLVAAILGFMSRGNSGRARPAMALAVIALILALAAPAMFAVALPGALAKDSPSHPSSGPWSTFFGSNTTQIGSTTITTTWGPGIGWYLSFGAFVVFLIGIILLARARKEPPAPAAAPMMGQDQSMMPPPASPPPS